MILVSIGANLAGPGGASPLSTCRAAVTALAGLRGLRGLRGPRGPRLRAVSRWYETEPVPASDQPNYVNGVARLERDPGDTIDPESLLASLQAIEIQFGRQRGERNAARTMDLDLIDVDGLVRDAPDPILPHPRAHCRAFVLLPLLDVAPNWVHPRSGRTGLALAREADQSGVRLLLP